MQRDVFSVQASPREAVPVAPVVTLMLPTVQRRLQLRFTNTREALAQSDKPKDVLTNSLASVSVMRKSRVTLCGVVQVF